MDELRKKLGSFGAKLGQTVTEGVASLGSGASDPAFDSETNQPGGDFSSESKSNEVFKKTLQAAASISFKMQSKFISLAVKFVAKHPPPLTLDLQFDNEQINEILLKCRESHCYSPAQLAWLDSNDQDVPPRVPVPEDSPVLKEINGIGQHMRSGDQAGAETAAVEFQKRNPGLFHPVIVDLCFKASMRTSNQDFQRSAALRKLKVSPFDRDAAVVANQSVDPASLRGQTLAIVLGEE